MLFSSLSLYFVHGKVGTRHNLEGVRIAWTIIVCELFFNGSCLNKISHLQMLGGCGAYKWETFDVQCIL